MQKLTDHEKRLNALAQVDYAEVIKESVNENVLNEVKNQLSTFVPKALMRTVLDVMKKNPVNLFKSSPTPSNDLTKYELKENIYEKMFETAAYLTHDAHRALYDAEQESIRIDELQARYESTQPSHKKRSHNDQDPPKNCKGENKKRR
ncbi:hypothetical protein Tco_1082508 [Tanacetum coccineum]|uniref:Uncharacterized protein n=1 Tax=Tanacetum coccineum TaxID=301880 RepID=A0ABQ5I0M1_9ASTR